MKLRASMHAMLCSRPLVLMVEWMVLQLLIRLAGTDSKAHQAAWRTCRQTAHGWNMGTRYLQQLLPAVRTVRFRLCCIRMQYPIQHVEHASVKQLHRPVPACDTAGWHCTAAH
jgi:hypothetical protein